MGENKVTRKFRKLPTVGKIYKYKPTGKFYIVANLGGGEYALVNMHTGCAFKRATGLSKIFAGCRASFIRQHVGAKFEVVVG